MSKEEGTHSFQKFIKANIMIKIYELRNVLSQNEDSVEQQVFNKTIIGKFKIQYIKFYCKLCELSENNGTLNM